MTTALLPPYPPTGVAPTYDCIEDLIDAIWDATMDLEQKFYQTNDEVYIKKFRMNILIIQYWDDIHLKIMEEEQR